MYKTLYIFLIAIFATNNYQNVRGANILGVFHVATGSHNVLMNSLFKELATRGHNVTLVSAFKSAENIPNFTSIEIDGLLKFMGDQLQGFSLNDKLSYDKYELFTKVYSGLAHITLESQAFKSLLKTTTKFDLLIVTTVFSESFLGIADHFNIPAINFFPQGSNSVISHLFGSTVPYAYVPHNVLKSTHEMTFTARLINVVVNTVQSVLLTVKNLPEQEVLLKKYFPKAPDLQTVIRDRLAVGLFNSHPAIESPRPYLPNMIQIGGFHVEKPEASLHQIFQNILNESTNGVVFFSFGSILRTSDLPEALIVELMEVFRGLEQTVFWKYDGVKPPENLPKNVRMGRWLPQKSILAHPNTKAFITHGGLGSITEAIYFGVPILCVPFTTDQFTNCYQGAENGYAIQVDYTDFNEHTVKSGLDELINNKVFKNNMESRSSLMRDQPVSSMDKAVFWIEHVIKHKGAPHLQSASVKLNWLQYFLLDVIALIFIVLFSLLALLYYILKILCKCICYFKKNSFEDIKKLKGDKRKKIQ